MKEKIRVNSWSQPSLPTIGILQQLYWALAPFLPLELSIYIECTLLYTSHIFTYFDVYLTAYQIYATHLILCKMSFDLCLYLASLDLHINV